MISRWRNLIGTLRASAQGSMAIETALVLPLLILMSFGTFEASMVVSRQYELQSAAAEAEIIAVAAATGAATDADKIKAILAQSVGLREEQITVTRFYRCNDSETLVSTKESCGVDDVVSNYVRLQMSDSYTPVWTEFGIGETINYNVVRTVMLS